MMMKIKNIGFWMLFIIYIGLFIADMWLTMVSLGHLSPYLEVNPLYKVGGFPSIIGVNLVVIFCLWKFYMVKKSTPGIRFMFINTIGMIIVARIYAIRNAIHWLRNPISVEVAKTIATESNKLQTITEMAWLAYLPYIYTIIVYIIWRCDHVVCRKDNERTEEC